MTSGSWAQPFAVLNREDRMTSRSDSPNSASCCRKNRDTSANLRCSSRWIEDVPVLNWSRWREVRYEYGNNSPPSRLTCSGTSSGSLITNMFVYSWSSPDCNLQSTCGVSPLPLVCPVHYSTLGRASCRIPQSPAPRLPPMSVSIPAQTSNDCRCYALLTP